MTGNARKLSWLVAVMTLFFVCAQFAIISSWFVRPIQNILPESTPNAQSCVVMALASGYDLNAMKPFLKSFRDHCPECQLVLFVSLPKLSSLEIQTLQVHYRAQLIDLDKLNPLYPAGSLVNHAPEPDIMFMNARWQLYYDYLRTRTGFSGSSFSSRPNFNPVDWDTVQDAFQSVYGLVPLGELSHVFFCDVRDLYFQGNIFSFLPYRHQFEGDDLLWKPMHKKTETVSAQRATTHGVFVFAEEVLVGQNYWNNLWTDCAKKSFAQQYTHRPVICAGTVLASLDSVFGFLETMQDYLLHKYPKCSIQYTFDQGALQMMVHEGELSNRVPTYIVPNARGPVSTNAVAFSDHAFLIKFNDQQQQINENGEIYSVVHQYDRVPQWKERIRRKFV